MNKYTKLFFDFDDTLIDFKAAEKVALPKVFEQYHFPLTETVEMKYREINKALWDQLERGEVTREALLERRFKETFQFFNRQVNGIEMDQAYRNLLVETIVLMDGAEEVLRTLSQNYDLYIVTNGICETQHKRLHAANLTSYFKGIFVSEETGYQKPQIQFFDYVFQQIGDVQNEECLIIGDSYSADMIGGKNANIDTCWFNPHNNEQPALYQPTYKINHLKDLLHIL
jgi:2-haloacid dehalogenase